MMSSALMIDAPSPDSRLQHHLYADVMAALAHLEKALEAAIEEGVVREDLQWTAAIEGKRPWLALLNVRPVEALAAEAHA